MRVLVTGGAGYVGTELVDELDKDENIDEITVYDNLSNTNNQFFWGRPKYDNVKFIKADILDSVTLGQSLENVDLVIHLAAYVTYPFNHHQNSQYEQINAFGTLSLVREIQKRDHIKGVIYLSSTSVLGFSEKLSSQSEANPENSYSKSKLSAEKYIELLKSKCAVKIIRAGNIFGYNRSIRMDSVINTMIFEALVDKKVIIYGDGTQQRPFVHVKKVVSQIVENLGSPITKTILSCEFNASINLIRDVLVNVKGIEYVHYNRNQKLNSQRISDFDLDENQIMERIKEEVEIFSNNLKF